MSRRSTLEPQSRDPSGWDRFTIKGLPIMVAVLALVALAIVGGIYWANLAVNKNPPEAAPGNPPPWAQIPATDTTLAAELPRAPTRIAAAPAPQPGEPAVRAAAPSKPGSSRERARPPAQEAPPVAPLDPEREAQLAKARLKEAITAQLDALHRDWRGIEASPGYFYFRAKNSGAAPGALIDAASPADAAQGLLRYAQWAVPGATVESLPTLGADQLARGRLRPLGRVTHVNRRVGFFIADFSGPPPREVLVPEGRTGRWHLLAASKVEGTKTSFTIPQPMDAEAVDESMQILVNKE